MAKARDGPSAIAELLSYVTLPTKYSKILYVLLSTLHCSLVTQDNLTATAITFII